MQVRNKPLILAISRLQVTTESVFMWREWGVNGSGFLNSSHFPAFWRASQLKQQSNQHFVCTSFRTRWHLYLFELWCYTFICLWLWLCKSELRDLCLGQSSQCIGYSRLSVSGCLSFYFLCILLCHDLWHKDQGKIKHSYTSALSILAYTGKKCCILLPFPESILTFLMLSHFFFLIVITEHCKNQGHCKRNLNRKVSKSLSTKLGKRH